MRGKWVVVVVALSACTSHGKKTIRIEEHEAAPASVSVDKPVTEPAADEPPVRERRECYLFVGPEDPL